MTRWVFDEPGPMLVTKRNARHDAALDECTAAGKANAIRLLI